VVVGVVVVFGGVGVVFRLESDFVMKSVMVCWEVKSWDWKDWCDCSNWDSMESIRLAVLSSMSSKREDKLVMSCCSCWLDVVDGCVDIW
jgi:hypothetical protein